MYCTSGCSVLVLCVVYFMLPGLDCYTYNYPSDSQTPKPCARLKNTIIYQGAICQWDDKINDYSPDSRKNCEEKLKPECPEFNQAACELKNNRHCCKLRYKARGFTWMEIFYTNQYGPGDYDQPVYDIIEISRLIQKHQDFGGRDQDDWPDNVIDPRGERGLKWIDVKHLKKPIFKEADITEKHICRNDKDGRCRSDVYSPGTIVQYLFTNYKEGFDESNKIMLSPLEEAMNASTQNSYEASCINILINKTRYPACRVLYRRYSYALSLSKQNVTLSSFIFMEAQFYNIPGYSDEISARYAYWNQEDPKYRDQIFTDIKLLPPIGKK